MIQSILAAVTLLLVRVSLEILIASDHQWEKRYTILYKLFVFNKKHESCIFFFLLLEVVFDCLYTLHSWPALSIFKQTIVILDFFLLGLTFVKEKRMLCHVCG